MTDIERTLAFSERKTLNPTFPPGRRQVLSEKIWRQISVAELMGKLSFDTCISGQLDRTCDQQGKEPVGMPVRDRLD